ncbi:hypothetical protein GCM10010869_28940 [Mesorhizobium tianshanense]|nr:hypothetical protein GCM10010869_28940 [Mesorhizobium tianshanense]
MGQLVGERETLPSRRMQCVYPDDRHTVANVGEAREVTIKRRILNAHTKRFCNSFDGHGRRSNHVPVE